MNEKRNLYKDIYRILVYEKNNHLIAAFRTGGGIDDVRRS